MQIDGKEQTVSKKEGTQEQRFSDRKYKDGYFLFFCFACMYTSQYQPIPKICDAFDKYINWGDFETKYVQTETYPPKKILPSYFL